MNRFYIRFIATVFYAAVTGPFHESTAQVKDTSSTKADFASFFFLTPQQQLSYYQRAEELLNTGLIKAGKKKYPLKNIPVNLSDFRFKFRDSLRSVNDFIKQTNVVGLLILRNDSILYERYEQGINASTRWISFSVSKSVTSLLFGAAVKDGYIHSLQDKVSDYIPELKGGVYDSVTLQQLLQMASGVKWNENPLNPKSDLFRIRSIEKKYGWKASLDSIAHLPRAAAPGKRFNYNTIETILAGHILLNATGKPLSQYLSEKIWKPFGMHADAYWIKTDAPRLENAGGGISATLRDYALIGKFALKNGQLKKQNVLPENWMQESTTSSPADKEYGYYWWLHPDKGRYFASGSFGQQIEIDPKTNTVIAVQSYWPYAFTPFYLNYIDTFIEALIKHINK